jgi:phosphoribosyl-ATP pyrophosphohydrolase/phosphoribosyl-AMP cyclohydrolase
MSFADSVRWNAEGLVPAIAQDAATGRVLTLAWMNRTALSATVTSGHAHYWSRSRRKLWKKGESSGHVQSVREVRLDCDRDAVLLIVDQAGGIACHTGRARCFYRRLERGEWQEVEPVLRDPDAIYGRGSPPEADPAAQQNDDAPARSVDKVHDVLASLGATIASRRGADAATSYVASLLAADDRLLKKIGEEATETVIAAKDGDRRQVVHEVADLWFHCLVLLARHDLSAQDVLAELARREGRSGHAEKASRGR